MSLILSLREHEQQSATEVSVVIPCLNEEESVGGASRRLRGARRRGVDGEVVVVDNGSERRLAELAAAAGARVVREPRRGYGSAYLRRDRRGARTLIVMADADDSYDSSTLAEFVAAAARRRTTW